MFPKFLILTAFLFASSANATVDLPNPKQHHFPITGNAVNSMKAFDTRFARFLNAWKMPGASVAIIQNGKLVFARGYGYADKKTRRAVQPNALFRIASVSKAITAVTVLKLVEEGRLHLDDHAFTLLNNLEPLAGRPKQKSISHITVKNLLQISSGWNALKQGRFDPMFGPWPHFFTSYLPVTPPASCKMTAQLMMTLPLQYRPGTQQSYINLDYCLLGLIINKVTQGAYGYQSYEDYVVRHILNPIGISDMRIGSTNLSERASNEVHYYVYPEKQIKPSEYLPYSPKKILKKNFADAGWLASATDLAKFVYALSRGKIISYAMVQKMTERPLFISSKKQHYFAMGLKVERIKHQRYWIMTGSFTGTNAFVLKKPNGTVIAVLFNSRAPGYSHFQHFRPQLQSLLLSEKMTF